jgi:hypothetical protein
LKERRKGGREDRSDGKTRKKMLSNYWMTMWTQEDIEN